MSHALLQAVAIPTTDFTIIAIITTILKTNVPITGIIDTSDELVLNPFPTSEIRGVLVAVSPDEAPGVEDVVGDGGADEVGGREAGGEEGGEHEGVRGGGEGVELGGNVGFRVDEVGGDGYGVVSD